VAQNVIPMTKLLSSSNDTGRNSWNSTHTIHRPVQNFPRLWSWLLSSASSSVDTLLHPKRHSLIESIVDVGENLSKGLYINIPRKNKFKVFEQEKNIGINCCLIDITPAPIREEITGLGLLESFEVLSGHIVP